MEKLRNDLIYELRGFYLPILYFKASLFLKGMLIFSIYPLDFYLLRIPIAIVKLKGKCQPKNYTNITRHKMHGHDKLNSNYRLWKYELRSENII